MHFFCGGDYEPQMHPIKMILYECITKKSFEAFYEQQNEQNLHDFSLYIF